MTIEGSFDDLPVLEFDPLVQTPVRAILRGTPLAGLCGKVHKSQITKQVALPRPVGADFVLSSFEPPGSREPLQSSSEVSHASPRGTGYCNERGRCPPVRWGRGTSR
jgi:hypothetical protein